MRTIFSVMFKGDKFLFHHASISERTYFFLLYCFSLVCLAQLSSSQQCSYIDDCKCVFPNGSIIDLSSLGYRDGPRWKNVKPSLNTDNYKYSYNPCFKFSFEGECKDVAVCQNDSKGNYFNIGSKAFFRWNSETNGLVLIYTKEGPEKKTNVNLVCSPTAETPTLDVTGEVNLTNYVMTLTTKCACPNLCHESHLSTGSVLVIIFMVFVILYLILGIVHSSLTRGAHGWELIPHHEFWADFPLLVRDGCVFVVSGCKPETAYERI